MEKVCRKGFWCDKSTERLTCHRKTARIPFTFPSLKHGGGGMLKAHLYWALGCFSDLVCSLSERE